MVVYSQRIHMSLEQQVSGMSCCCSLMLLVFLCRVSVTLCLMGQSLDVVHFTDAMLIFNCFLRVL